MLSLSSSSSYSLRFLSPPPPPGAMPPPIFNVKMGEKKKKGAKLVKLVSSAGTGFFYVFKKSRTLQNNFTKLEFKKFDPRIREHVLFTEEKMKR
ncbi:hypothetical protein ABFS82_07G022000 [Erythranthe guttata]